MAVPTETAANRRDRLRAARLYLVCGARPGGRDPEPVLRAALASGVGVLQLREKDAPDEEVLRAAEVFARIAAEHEVPFILNDRPDLALRCGADGVHLGQDDMPVGEARAIVGEELIIGRSTHSPEQVDAAVGVDYIAVGPVHATPTKPGRPGVGLDLVHHAAAHARVPFFAIGGIDAETVDAVVAAGARRVVVVRAIAEAADPGAAARALYETLEAAGGPA